MPTLRWFWGTKGDQWIESSLPVLGYWPWLVPRADREGGEHSASCESKHHLAVFDLLRQLEYRPGELREDELSPGDSSCGEQHHLQPDCSHQAWPGQHRGDSR